MIIDWTKNLKTATEKKEFEAIVKGSTTLLSRLKDILSEREGELDRIELKLETYDSPSWSHKQAHINGRRQELNWIKTLISNDPRNPI